MKLILNNIRSALKLSLPAFMLPVVFMLPICQAAMASTENTTNQHSTRSMTAIYSIPGHTEKGQCIISSTDTLQDLRNKKNRLCPLTGGTTKPYVLLTVRDEKESLRHFLVNTRTVLNWAYMAVHVWKLLDSGYKLASPPICPCSGLPKSRGPKSVFFFSYYVLSMMNHGWEYLTSYLPGYRAAQEEITNDEEKSAQERFSEQLSEQLRAGHLLTLALDAAALKWDCQCGGYFSDAQGNFYFNGHLWMLMLNMGIYATDLALEYL